MQSRGIVIWSIRLIIAAILLSVVSIKFNAQPENISDFAKIGIGTRGRILAGILELIAILLILIPRTTGWGALLLILIMTSIIFSYFSNFDENALNSFSQLFYKFIIVWFGSVILFIIYRGQVLRIVNRVLNRI